MSIETQEEVDALRAAARVVAEAPGCRRLRDGGLVNLDLTAELDGFYGDARVTAPNHCLPYMTQTLTEGLVLTIEPIVLTA